MSERRHLHVLKYGGMQQLNTFSICVARAENSDGEVVRN